MTATRHDITTRADIERLVDTFYERVRGDEILAPIFDDVAHTDWARHLPKMYDFWTTVLFGQAAYSGTPLSVHRITPCASRSRQVPSDRWPPTSFQP